MSKQQKIKLALAAGGVVVVLAILGATYWSITAPARETNNRAKEIREAQEKVDQLLKESAE